MITKEKLKVRERATIVISNLALQRSSFTVEKTSWLSLARGPTTSDQWRHATCRIAEEEEGCVLNVYLEVSSHCLSFAI
jgi:hypothetical protein